jgi:ketosteroid isomerase-like protein
MKVVAIILGVLFLGALIPVHAQNLPDAGDRDSSKAVFGRIALEWLEAYNGTDARELVPLYTEDAVYISSHVAGLVAEGRDRVIENFRRGMATGGHLDDLKILSINHSCDVATVLCQYFANNSGQRVSGRTLLVMKKVHGRWLIAIHMTVV